ncbi:11761_t:CDS:2 [Acaulospora colombiana]|uniref:11761_t:CDS:1 n=1 Tax=Acaulospora colombiana TaxID=27376 RepID=A0ACA9LT34_9GLOM|nr:11761_t:CDS:2 [Acaulospora colombiana]
MIGALILRLGELRWDQIRAGQSTVRKEILNIIDNKEPEDYFEGRIEWVFENGDVNEFVGGRFDVKFLEGILLEDVEQYIYDNQISDLYEKEGNVYLKVKINVLNIIGAYYKIVDNLLLVYNKYWKGDEYERLKEQHIKK